MKYNLNDKGFNYIFMKAMKEFMKDLYEYMNNGKRTILTKDRSSYEKKILT